MSKGSSQRPKQVTNDKFDSNWDKIFNKGKTDGSHKTKKKRKG